MIRSILFLILLCSMSLSVKASAQITFWNSAVWGNPYWKRVRATCYPAGGKSAMGVRVQYALFNQVGTAAIPDWIPPGSIIRIWSRNGIFVYVAADTGPDVSSRRAAKRSAKNAEQKKDWVIDFCAPKESWSERIYVEIIPYCYHRPFGKLSPEEKRLLLGFGHLAKGAGRMCCVSQRRPG